MNTASRNIPGLDQFLIDYPLMAFRPRAGRPPILRGRFAFVATHIKQGEVEDCFDLEIEIPPNFPHDVPRVTEIGGRIIREADEHVNGADGTLCLGSPLRIRSLLAQEPTLSGFARNCLVPFLFAQSKRLAGANNFIFGELRHGGPGKVDDYLTLFRLTEAERVVEALRLLGMKKRKANKYPCPCGCARRLGRCRFNRTVRRFRRIASRPWFRAECDDVSKHAAQISERQNMVRSGPKLAAHRMRSLKSPKA